MEGSLPPDIGDLSLSGAHQTLSLPDQTVQQGWILQEMSKQPVLKKKRPQTLPRK